MHYTVLWIRLKNNPDWCLKPIDSNIQDFIWNKLKSLKEVQWYNIKQPRKTPTIFKVFEDFISSVEKDDIQVLLSVLLRTIHLRFNDLKYRFS